MTAGEPLDWSACMAQTAMVSSLSGVETFSVDFLGCKVSYTDAQAVRERLLAGGLTEDTAAVILPL